MADHATDEEALEVVEYWMQRLRLIAVACVQLQEKRICRRDVHRGNTIEKDPRTAAWIEAIKAAEHLCVLFYLLKDGSSVAILRGELSESHI